MRLSRSSILLGGIMALAMLTIAARPADEDHAYGHGKAEYFSSGLEGGLILVAAISIAVAAALRLFTPKPLEELGIGIAISLAASVVNLVVALLLLRAGRKHNSITLEANAHHLLTDVWTSVGVIAGIGLVIATGWQWLDPVVALLVAANITRTAVGIMRRSVGGLMDAAIPPKDLEAVRKIFQTYEANGVKFHACAPAKPAPAGSFRCTCLSPATGPSIAATNCSSRSKPTFAWPFPTQPSSRTWNPSTIRRRGRMKH
jgi:cation diffusion facilitator family transporter